MLEERFGLPLRVLMEANAKELEKLATPGNDQLSEGFAEFIRRYVTNPNMAEARARAEILQGVRAVRRQGRTVTAEAAA